MQRLPCCPFISGVSGHSKEVLCINDSDDLWSFPAGFLPTRELSGFSFLDD